MTLKEGINMWCIYSSENKSQYRKKLIFYEFIFLWKKRKKRTREIREYRHDEQLDEAPNSPF